jgi:hypothetical protein
MRLILLAIVISSFSITGYANDSMLDKFKGESKESIQKDFFLDKGYAELSSPDKTMVRYEDDNNSFTFVFVNNKVVDAYKIIK